MAKSFLATPRDAFTKIYIWAALPEVLGGVRIGLIRAAKGVIIGQLLISIVGFGALFELYSSKSLMAHFWAVLIVLFAMAFTVSELLADLERRVSYYASSQQLQPSPAVRDRVLPPAVGGGCHLGIFTIANAQSRSRQTGMPEQGCLAIGDVAGIAHGDGAGWRGAVIGGRGDVHCSTGRTGRR